MADGDNLKTRGLLYVLLIALVIALFTVTYSWGMQEFEGESRSMERSLQVVTQTLTTTGYGEDSPWSSTEMTAIMVAMQFSGVIIVFSALPILVVPWVRRTLEKKPPKEIEGIEDHVVICGYQLQEEHLADKFDSRDVDYVVVERDRERAMELNQSGISAIHADPESIEGLESANIEKAKSVVIDDTDEIGASITLSAKETNPDVQTITLVDDPSNTPYLNYAGADKVLSPQFLIGLSLADKVASSVTARLGSTSEIEGNFEIAEIPVQEDSDLHHKVFSDCHIRGRTGASVIGVWKKGEFISPVEPDMEIDDDTVLLAAGSGKQLESLKDISSQEEGFREKDVIIAGHGDVGRSIYAALESRGLARTVIDKEKMEVDIVGDATEKRTLKKAGIEDADALIVALPNDTDAVFTSLLARNMNEDIEIISKANQSSNTGKLYRAGSDYVLALSNVVSRMIALNVLEEDIITPGERIDIVKTEVPDLVGVNLEESGIREETGCTVVAVERNGRNITDIGSDLVIQESDRLVVAGTEEDVERFTERFGNV